MRKVFNVYAYGAKVGVVTGEDAADAMAEARLWGLDEDTGYVRVEHDRETIGRSVVGDVYECHYGDRGPWVAAAFDCSLGLWIVNQVTGETKNISTRAVFAGTYEQTGRVAY